MRHSRIAVQHAAGITVLALLGSAILVVFSPKLIMFLDDSAVDWDRLSKIAQAYGAMSGVLSGIAIVGVIASLLLQARATWVERRQTQRMLHFDLLKMALADPGLMACWNMADLSRPESNAARQHIYLNMIFALWQMMFDLGDITPAGLRTNCRDIFANPRARSYWLRTVVAWRQAPGSRAMQFVAIVNEEYERSAAVDRAPSPADQRG